MAPSGPTVILTDHVLHLVHVLGTKKWKKYTLHYRMNKYWGGNPDRPLKSPDKTGQIGWSVSTYRFTSPNLTFWNILRGEVKYYFADFVPKGGGRGYPQIRNPLFAENFVREGGGGVPPISVTYFLDQNQVFFEQKTQFLALFEEKFSGVNP